jgi:hypothetical protein
MTQRRHSPTGKGSLPEPPLLAKPLWGHVSVGSNSDKGSDTGDPM